MSDRIGTFQGRNFSGVLSSARFSCSQRMARNAVRPVTKMLMKKPAMIWSTR